MNTPYSAIDLVAALNQRHANRTHAPEIRDTFDAWAADTIAALQSKNSALEADARRYQWVRLADDNGPRTRQMQYHHVEHLDAAIDAALAKARHET